MKIKIFGFSFLEKDNWMSKPKPRITISHENARKARQIYLSLFSYG